MKSVEFYMHENTIKCDHSVLGTDEYSENTSWYRREWHGPKYGTIKC